MPRVVEDFEKSSIDKMYYYHYFYYYYYYKSK